ncbi:MBL fold metallo-hydrolase [Geopsychrobacter electrodiphilus]|uniref:MBL fold metallo-hydrolase n=1 Tax=Geopsychrobacter electrodiphilus TaxID=225196 RepID=UPI000378FCFC|nr:MBL fold metallo-hydrolase [Geopsychrobacter electrodiphilus]
MIKQHTITTPYMVGDVHFYSARLKGELVLFDCGPPTEAAWDLIKTEIGLSELRHVFMTHCHIDHWGNAARLGKETGASIYLPQRDVDKMVHHDRRIEGMMEVLLGYGFSAAYLSELRAEIDNDTVFPTYPERYEVVETSPELVRLGIEMLPCPGHSQSDLVYRIGNQAVTGDVLLRGIFQSPLLDIDLQTLAGRFHNYRAYCNSLQNLVSLRDCQILPGHRYTIESVDATVLFYLRKMLDRALKLKSFAREPDVAGLIERLFGDQTLPLFHTYLKASEIIFMQDLLNEPELLKRALENAGLFDTLAGEFNKLL